jgi:hypothetical protein
LYLSSFLMTMIYRFCLLIKLQSTCIFLSQFLRLSSKNFAFFFLFFFFHIYVVLKPRNSVFHLF